MRDINQTKYLKSFNIEICVNIKRSREITHVIFDHDGTISTLRQGWEEIMEKVMIRAILGEKYKTYSDDLRNKVKIYVRDYIDKSTGIQSILQMEALVKMVHKFGFVPKQKILDKFGYKKIYNKEILKVVNKRITQLKNGGLDINYFKINGIMKLLKLLKEKETKLYLVSGTDHEDVVNEAKVLGYMDFFNGGIYGSLNDLSKFSKRMIIKEVIKKNNLKGQELMVIGDGPVEIKECRRVNGIAVGVASEESKRFGVNPEKRIRLIESGAHIIIPDYSKADLLVNFLFNN